MTPDKIAEQLKQDASAYSQGFADGYRLAKKALITCKECKHWYRDGDTGMACEFTNLGQPEEGFCNWAEREE